MNALVNLLDLDADGLATYCGELGEKPFRARQLQRWIHQFGASRHGLAIPLQERRGVGRQIPHHGVHLQQCNAHVVSLSGGEIDDKGRGTATFHTLLTKVGVVTGERPPN